MEFSDPVFLHLSDSGDVRFLRDDNFSKHNRAGRRVPLEHRAVGVNVYLDPRERLVLSLRPLRARALRRVGGDDGAEGDLVGEAFADAFQVVDVALRAAGALDVHVEVLADVVELGSDAVGLGHAAMIGAKGRVRTVCSRVKRRVA